MLATELRLGIDRPFPGLRAFEPEESLIFFGREQQRDEVLRRLSSNRFLGIVGMSGSGKSSLVRAGVLPALYRGYLAGATSSWRIALMRPGGAPLDELDKALASPDALGEDRSGARSALVRSSSLGLAGAIRKASFKGSESLLIVVDQFEELFRFRDDAKQTEREGDAALFVSLLLKAVEEHGIRVYVVLTMRSDFLGDCANFSGLAEALSKSQYLIPRLTREQRQESIERPLQLAGIAVDPALVQRLLNEAGEDPDQLPVLQHALMRTHLKWREGGGQGPIAPKHYDAAGGIQNALDDHATGLYRSLKENERAWAERVFRCLTVIQGGRAVRRPMRLDRLCAAAGASESASQDVYRAIQRYLRREDSLLFSTTGEDLRDDSVIDIQHESLIWNWSLLRQWAREEESSSEWYRELAQNVARYLRDRTSGLWTDPDLRQAQDLRASAWNAAWAKLYWPSDSPTFAEVTEFLDLSARIQARDRLKRWALKAGLITLCILLLMFSYTSYRAGERAKNALKDKEAALQALTSVERERARRERELKALKEEQAKTGKLTEEQTKKASSLEAQVKQDSDIIAQLKASANKPSGPDLSATVRALQSQVESLQRERDTAVTKSATLQTSLDTAVAARTAAENKAADLQSSLNAFPKQKEKPADPTADALDATIKPFEKYLTDLGLKAPATSPAFSFNSSAVWFNLKENRIEAPPEARTNLKILLWAFAFPFTRASLSSSVHSEITNHPGESYLAMLSAHYFGASYSGAPIYPFVDDSHKPKYNWLAVFWSIREAVGKTQADLLIANSLMTATSPLSTQALGVQSMRIDSYFERVLRDAANHSDDGKLSGSVEKILSEKPVMALANK